MRWITQVLQHVSAQVLADQTGISVSSIYRANRGEASEGMQHKINVVLQDFRGGEIIEKAYEAGKRLTVRDVEAPKKEVSYKHEDIDELAREIKKHERKLSVDEIAGILERDRYTRAVLGDALTTYQEAKRKAIHEYTTRGVKRETLDDYIKRKTEKEYEALGKAFKSRRETEENKKVKRLMTKNAIDFTIENYGRGKGQWYRVRQ